MHAESRFEESFEPTAAPQMTAASTVSLPESGTAPATRAAQQTEPEAAPPAAALETCTAIANTSVGKPSKTVKVGRLTIMILAAIVFFRLCSPRRTRTCPTTISASLVRENEPTLRERLKDSKAIGDGLGGHGLKLARHPQGGGFQTSCQTFSALRGLLISNDLATEMLQAALVDTLAELDDWIRTRPTNEELARVPLKATRSSGKKAAAPTTPDELRELVRLSASAAEGVGTSGRPGDDQAEGAAGAQNGNGLASNDADQGDRKGDNGPGQDDDRADSVGGTASSKGAAWAGPLQMVIRPIPRALGNDSNSDTDNAAIPAGNGGKLPPHSSIGTDAEDDEPEEEEGEQEVS